jgi:DNA-binding XRE family transcriptional regulator
MCYNYFPISTKLSAMNPERKNHRKLVFDKEGIEAFAIQLKKIRLEKGLSQNQLAFEAGLSLSQVARIETARINPTLSTVIILARTLDITLPELFDFELPTKANS